MSTVTIAHLDDIYVKMPLRVFQLCHENKPGAFGGVETIAVGAGVTGTAACTNVPVELTAVELMASLTVGSAMMLPGPRILPKRSSRP